MASEELQMLTVLVVLSRATRETKATGGLGRPTGFPCCVLSYFSFVFVKDQIHQIQITRVGQSTRKGQSHRREESESVCTSYFRKRQQTFDKMFPAMAIKCNLLSIAQGMCSDSDSDSNITPQFRVYHVEH